MALKILLADDSMTAQNMGKKILADAGHEVLAVSNGAAAIKKIASDRPDIIILDVYMPGYTGLEVCERVKAASETARIPVLLTVGKMEPFKPEEANRVRADGVMIKPFEATDLIAAIDGISKKMKSATASDGASPVPSIAKQLHVEPVQKPQVEATPEPNADHEETIRLTPEQVRALQDQSFKHWPPKGEAQQTPKPEDDSAFIVTPLAVVEQSPNTNNELEVSAVSILEPAKSDFAVYEDQPTTAYAPGLDATQAPMTRAMAGHDFFTVTPPAPAAAEPEESFGQNSPAAFFASEDSPSTASERVFKLQQFEEPESSAAAFSASSIQGLVPELETSALIAAAPTFVSPVQEVAEAAPELEINSPIHLQPEVNVSQDAALVTESDDLSQFATRFGVEGAEEIQVGIAADLPADQLAAINLSEADTATFTVQQLEVQPTGVQSEEKIVQEVPVLEPAESLVPPIIPLAVPAPVLEDVNSITPEAEPVAEDVSPTGAHSGFLGEVGCIEAETPLNGTARMVAYVPGFGDTQPIPAFVSPEREPSTAIHEAAVAPAFEAPAPVAEAAAATHFFIASQPVPSMEQLSAQPAEMSVEPVAVFTPEQPIADTALAEELAQTLVEKEAAVLASTTKVEPESTASEDATEPGSETMRLTDAVARAFDRLRPTLIAEILKEIKR